MMRNENEALIALGMAIDASPKSITKEARAILEKVENNIGNITVDVDIEKVSEKFKKINDIARSALKDVDLTKQFNSIFEVFGDATKTVEDYIEVLNKVEQEFINLSNIGSKANGRANKDILKMLPYLNQREISKALKDQEEIEARRIKSIEAVSKAQQRADSVDLMSKTRLRSLYEQTEKYQKGVSDETVNNLISRMGIAKPTNDIKKEVKEYAELVALFDILQEKKTELAKPTSVGEAEENIKVTKTLLSLYEQIETKRKMFASNSKYKVEDTTIGLPENYKEMTQYAVLNAVNTYVGIAERQAQASVTEAEDRLNQYIINAANKHKEKADEAFARSAKNVQDKISGGQSASDGMAVAEENIHEVGQAAKDSATEVGKLNDAMSAAGGSSGGNELDLWRKSAENLKEEFADVIKYAVDTETAFSRVNELMDKKNPLKGNTSLSRDESVELLGYIQRLSALDEDLSEEINKYFYQNKNMPGFKKIEGRIFDMTVKQLEEIERLKAASTKEPVLSSSKIDEATESLEKATNATKEFAESEENAGKQSGVFAVSAEEADKLNSSILSIAENISKVTPAPFVGLGSEISKATKEAENLAVAVKKIMSSSETGIGKTVKDWNDSDVLMKEYSELRERKAFGNSKTGYMTNAYSSGDRHGFSGEMAKKIFESAVQQVDSMMQSHSFESAAISSNDIKVLQNYLNRGVSKTFVKAFKEVAELDVSKMSDVDKSKLNELINLQEESEKQIYDSILNQVHSYKNFLQSIDSTSFVDKIAINSDEVDNISSIPQDIKDSITKFANENVSAVVDSFKNSDKRIRQEDFAERIVEAITKDLNSYVANNDVDKSTLDQIDAAKARMFSDIVDQINAVMPKVSNETQEKYQTALKEALLGNMKKLNMGNIDDFYKVHSIEDFVKENTFGANNGFLNLGTTKIDLVPNVDVDSFIATIEQKLSGRPVKVSINPEVADGNGLVVGGDFSKEEGAISRLKSALSEIVELIGSKNELFKSEEAIVSKSIPNETNYLGKLISSLKIIKEYLDGIAKFSGLDLSNIKIPELKNGDSGKIASGATNISGDPKKAKKVKERTAIKAEKMTTEEIEARTKSLTETTDRLERELLDSGSIVKEIVEFYDSQENLVKTVLKEEKELDGVIKKTTWTTNYNKNDNSSFSSHIDTYDYETIRKRELAEESRLEKERLDQSRRIANEEKKTRDALSRDSYAQEKKWIAEIYALKEKNAQAVENNSPTQERDIAYNNALIRSYEELIADEKEYRTEKGLSNDNRNQTYELSLLSQYEAKRDAYNQSLEESIRLAQQEAEIQNRKINDKLNSDLRKEETSSISKKSNASYEKEYKLEQEINELKIKNLSATNAEVKANEVLIARKQELINRERTIRANAGWGNADKDAELTNKKATLSQEFETAQNAYNARLNEMKKYAGEVTDYVLELKQALSGLGLQSVKVKGQEDGSAIITFIKNIGNESVSTTIKISDMLDALDKIEKGKFNPDEYSPVSTVSDGKNTGESSKKTKEIDSVSEAYRTLIRTEKDYRELTEKQKINGTLSPKEAGKLKDYTEQREAANAVIREANELTEEQLKLQKEYNDKKLNVSNYLARYVEVLNKNKFRKDEEEATAINKKAADEYKNLAERAKEYYTLLFKKKDDNIKLTLQEEETLKELQKLFNDAQTGTGQFAKSAIGDTTDYDKAQKDFIKRTLDLYKYDTEDFIAEKQKKLGNVTINKRSLKYVEEYNKKLDLLKTKLSQLEGLNIDAVTQEDILQIAALRNEIEGLLSEIQGQTKNKEFMSLNAEDAYKDMAKIQDFLRDNTAMALKYKIALKDLEGRYQVLIDLGASQKEFEDLREEFAKLLSEIKDTGKTGDSFATKTSKKIVGKSASFLAYFVSIYDFYRYLRQGFETIRELDSALTEMRKVSDETVASLERFSDVSFELARNVGTTAVQIQKSAADFMRLGESLDQAKKSAQEANILFNVSEFESIDDATTALISMSQAYSDMDKMDIIDKLNIVGKIKPKHVVIHGDMILEDNYIGKSPVMDNTEERM